MKVAFDDGLIITQEQMQIDINKTKQNVEEAHSSAFALSLKIAYPTPENTGVLLQVAHREAYLLSLSASVPTKETIVDLIKKAHVEMLSLSSRLSTLEKKAAPEGSSEKG
jgi:hypothetical protein